MLTGQIFLMLFAAMIFASTHYGFGMHVVDIVRTGGDVKEALKVRTDPLLPTP